MPPELLCVECDASKGDGAGVQAVNASYATILPIMLSTMALPEMEAEEKALLAQRDASVAAMSDSEQHAALAVSSL